MTSHSDVHKAGAARLLARDDLLQVAHAAEDAVGIVHQRDRHGHDTFTEPELFTQALHRHLAGADAGGSDSWAIRGQHLAHAGAIVRFCELVDIWIADKPDSVDLYHRALGELSANSDALTAKHEDLTLGVITTCRAVRDLRLAGRPQDAFLLAWKPDEYFHGSGAEPHRGHFEFEISAAKFELSDSAQAAAALRESEGYWKSPRAADWPTRNRYEFAQALAAFAEGDDGATERHLEAALSHLRRTRSAETQHDIQELSLLLALTEHLTMGPMSEKTTRRALHLINEAVSFVERIRGRWRVVLRSRSPLSLAFQRIYGDIALLASEIPGPEAGELGLRVALSAKQTGFASLMRTSHSLMNNRLSNLLREIVECEDQLEYANFTSDDERTRRYADLDILRAELEDAFSPLLADFVIPEPTDLGSVVKLVGTRYVLDFVALPETASGDTNWFRTLIRPDGSIEFGRVRPGPAFRAFFRGDGGSAALVNSLDAATSEHDWVWRGLAQELLPTTLLDTLAATTADAPVQLLVSPHSDLCFVPWAALEVDGSRTRLIEAAIVTQTPALTCLSNTEVPPVRGPALVRLVAQPDAPQQRHGHQRGVNVERERAAWGLRIDNYGEVPLSRCDLGPQHNGVDVTGTLVSALADEHSSYGFVHIAVHGDGIGLAQEIMLPERLTAGHALGVRWPASVLLAACHVGRGTNVRDAEPLGFPVALLAGGAQCVVAGILAISDQGTGLVAAAMVNSLRPDSRLDVVLRDAQRIFLDRGVYDWGLLSAFVR